MKGLPKATEVFGERRGRDGRIGLSAHERTLPACPLSLPTSAMTNSGHLKGFRFIGLFGFIGFIGLFGFLGLFGLVGLFGF